MQKRTKRSHYSSHLFHNCYKEWEALIWNIHIFQNCNLKHLHSSVLFVHLLQIYFYWTQSFLNNLQLISWRTTYFSLLWNPNIQYHAYKSSPEDPILCHVYPICTPSYPLLKNKFYYNTSTCTFVSWVASAIKYLSLKFMSIFHFPTFAIFHGNLTLISCMTLVILVSEYLLGMYINLMFSFILSIFSVTLLADIRD